MHCEECVLEQRSAAESLDEFHAALGRCDECPLRTTTNASPVVQLLVERHLESARMLRKMTQKLRAMEAHVRDMEISIEHQEEKISMLETIQRAATEDADAALREKDQMVEHLDEAVVSLSTPIIHVFDGVVVLPLVGALDARRAELMTSKLLEAVTHMDATHVIIDLTGIAELNAETITRIANAALALQLLGTETHLTGLRAEAARTAVSLGTDLSHLRTLRTLKEAVVRISRESRTRRMQGIRNEKRCAQ